MTQVQEPNLPPSIQNHHKDLSDNERADGPVTASRKSSLVLLAEDNHVSANVAVRLLKKHGYENVAVVENGFEAVQFVQAHIDVKVILMDCQMPVMDGFSATKLIREAGNLLPIIALTASAEQDNSHRCLECGMTDVVIKPFDIQNLVKKIDNYVSLPTLQSSTFGA